MAVSEGAIIQAAVFNSLLGILSRPVAFLSSIFFEMFNTIVCARERFNSVFPGKLQDLHLHQEYLLLVLAKYL